MNASAPTRVLAVTTSARGAGAALATTPRITALATTPRISALATTPRRIAALAIVALVTGCDQLNRPIGGASSTSSSGAPPRGGASEDAGDASADAASPAPLITAEPGDVHL